MSSALAPVWFNFFLEAGIPPADAGNYAVTFTQNRIQPDMMTDLTKEYLAEMGITVLGDVIAIMKHARMVHTQAAREKALQFTGLSRELPNLEIQQSVKLPDKQTGTSNPMKAVPKATGSSSVKTTSNAIRLHTSDEDIMLTTQSLQKAGASQRKEITHSKPVSDKTSSVLKMVHTSSHNVRDAPVVSTASVKKSTKLDKTVINQSNGGAIRLRTSTIDGVLTSQSLQKAGLLKVTTSAEKGNAGTRRHSEVPQSKNGSGEIKSSVFNRLGQEVTNSIKTPPTTASSKTTFRVTMQGLDSEDVIPTQAKSAPIFKRLGNKTNVESRLVSDGKVVPPVAGRIASPTVKPTIVRNLEKRLGPVRNTSASSTVTSTSEGILGTENGTGGSSVRLRLGVKRPASTVTVDSSSQPSPSKKANVKARLGVQNSSSVSISEARPVAAVKPPLIVQNSKAKTTGVFGRLGSLKS